MCRHTENYKTHFELPVNKTEQLIRPNQNCFQELKTKLSIKDVVFF